MRAARLMPAAPFSGSVGRRRPDSTRRWMTMTSGHRTLFCVARDDEFRKVAEDIGALARSLGRDFREAVDQAMRGGSGPGRAVRHGLRGVSDEARRGLRNNWSESYRRRP